MRNKQRYRCCTCGYVFQNKSRQSARSGKKLWEDYALHKQTYTELARREGCSIRTIQTRLDAYDPWYQYDTIIPPRVWWTHIVLLMDTTYFGHDFGIIVFKSAHSKQILFTMIVDWEKTEHYLDAIQKIQEAGWIIDAIVCDGKRGLLWGCTDLSYTPIPTQLCQFHQIAIVTRATTKKPKTEANKELKQLAHLLTRTDKETFTYELEQYWIQWWSYMTQKTLLSSWRWTYTHKKTRSAYESLKRNLQYLFVWYDYHGQLDIPNTTSWLEGSFGHLKAKVSLHRWLKRKRKLKLILTLLYGK